MAEVLVTGVKNRIVPTEIAIILSFCTFKYLVLLGNGMGLNGISCSLGQGVGKLVVGTRKVLSLPASTLGKAVEKLRPVFPRARIRAIIAEELMRFMAQKEPVEEKLEQRLKIMAETMLALQERLDEMINHGHVSEMDMLEALDSIKTAESLTNDERTVLVNVFRQNIAIQKPKFVGAEID